MQATLHLCPADAWLSLARTVRAQPAFTRRRIVHLTRTYRGCGPSPLWTSSTRHRFLHPQRELRRCEHCRWCRIEPRIWSSGRCFRWIEVDQRRAVSISVHHHRQHRVAGSLAASCCRRIAIPLCLSWALGRFPRSRRANAVRCLRWGRASLLDAGLVYDRASWCTVHGAWTL